MCRVKRRSGSPYPGVHFVDVLRVSGAAPSAVELELHGEVIAEGRRGDGHRDVHVELLSIDFHSMIGEAGGADRAVPAELVPDAGLNGRAARLCDVMPTVVRRTWNPVLPGSARDTLAAEVE